MIKSMITTPKCSFSTILLFTMLVVVGLAASLSPALSHAQTVNDSPDLSAGQRVYDETETSLTPAQIAGLEQRLNDLASDGVDIVVYVRALDATPEETLEQVEALQQAWVAETGADQDTAVAMLINRNPADSNDARAGIYVGKTFNDGNVPGSEQRAIVDKALIPPLRDGDVYASLIAGLDRLDSSIRNGPPRSSFEKWASEAGSSWLPWVGVTLALIGFAVAVMLFRRRQTTGRPDEKPTTDRPGVLSPAIAGALVAGRPQPSAVPATLLDLAARDALDIEPEREGGRWRKPTIQVRLLDGQLVANDVEKELWNKLEERVEDGVVSSKNLQKVSRDSKAVLKAIENQLRAEGWLDPEAGRRKAGLMIISFVAVVLAVFGIVVAAAGEQWMPVSIGIVALGLLAVIGVVFFGYYSRLSKQGQEAAIPWKAYRDGLKQAAKDETVVLDLDVVLVDAVAMNLGSAMNDRLKEANESGEVLRAFTSRSGLGQANAPAGVFPWWIAFNSTISTSSGSGTVSGGGAGGGGGAAGST